MLRDLDLGAGGSVGRRPGGTARAALGRYPGGILESMPRFQIAQDPAADAVLADNPFALLCGMLLDQRRA